MIRGHARLARFAAPAAFLAAATIAILIVRAGLEDGSTAPTPAPVAATTTASTTAVDTTPRPRATTPTATTAAEYYEIQAGDTLEVVAAREGTTVEALLALNPDVDPVALRIGDKIRVK